MEKEQLFFDLDHTLWDFEANSKNALSILYTDLGLDKITNHFVQFHRIYKRVNAELWALYANNKLSKEELRIQRFTKTLRKLKIEDDDLAQRLCDGYIEISPNQTLLFPNTIETLTELKQLDYKMSIITNGFSEVQFRKLENCNLMDFFDTVVCSEVVGYAKPDKRVYNYAASQVNTSHENCVMIGDSVKADVLGAVSAGMRGILFDPNPKKTYSQEILRIKDLSELPLLLMKDSF